jgi:oligopeptide transport system substrate-binding protein
VSLFLAGCTSSAKNRFWGKTAAPADNVLRYISGSEPESLDPHVSTGQPEARVYLALYEGLVEFHPKTMEPIPAIAERWDISADGTEYTFHLRKNAKFSNGDPIKAQDFEFSIRRALSPEIAAKGADLAYYIKYAEGYNQAGVFVRDAHTGTFLLKKDFITDEKEKAALESASQTAAPENMDAASERHKFLNTPERLVLKGDEKSRAKELADEKLKAAVEGKEFVSVTAENLGIEAVDDYTFRIKMRQPAPYFLGLLTHQLFRVLHRSTIEKFGKNWTRPENIVTSGTFKLAAHKPYDELIVVKDPNNWDAASVKLAGIEFYPLEEGTTMMNLYKAGIVDAIYNHTTPPAWLSEIKQYKDEYLNLPEVAVEFYSFKVKQPPFDNLKVRQAFSLAVNRDALAEFRQTVKPLYDFTPEGIFPKYEEARKKVQAELRQTKNISQEEWDTNRRFNPEKARKLLAEAGYPVVQSGNTFSCPSFPLEKAIINYNTAESNKMVAEFMQAQWKQHLGITLPLKNMEWKTFLDFRNKVQYDGIVRHAWVGDYMDPFTFLGLHYTAQNQGATGWTDPQYDKMLDDANKTVDEAKRYELLARAEQYLMDQQLFIPLMTQGTNWIKKPYVKGMYPNPGTLFPWKFVYIERDPNKWDANVDNIMKTQDAAVDEQVSRLVSSQKASSNAAE